MDGTTYTDLQAFEVIANVDYINVNINNIATTITSKGRLFYNADSPSQGLGFAYKDSFMAYECGLIIGASSAKVVNNIRSTAGAADNDFRSMVSVKRNRINPISDFDLFGKFNDSLALASAMLNIQVPHKSFAWNEPEQLKYVIVEYTIKNKSTAALNNLYAGIFTDWDIQRYNMNKSDQDPAIKLGYAYCTPSTELYAGVKVLTAAPFNLYAADNVTGGGGGIDMSDGFDTAEKYQALSTSRPQAGTTGTGVDVINVVSTGPFNISVGDSVTVAFALIGGDDFADLRTSANNAQIKYDAMFAGINDVENGDVASIYNYPNPTNGNTKFIFNISKNSNVSLVLYDATGKFIKTIVNTKYAKGSNSIDADLTSLSQGLYTYVLKTDDATVVKKLSITK